jgi:uncharacterized protein DUF1707
VSAQPPTVRASDEERERTVELLRRHAGDGRLTLEELADRIESAYASRTRDELEAVTVDLPAAPSGAPPKERRRPKRLTGVVFGSVERKGRWRLARRALVLIGFGDANIDLRQAQLDSDVVTITAFVVFGNADFFVPEGVDVDLGGLTVFGHRGEHGDDVPAVHSGPFVRVRVFSLFGTSDVWRIPHGAQGTYGQLIKSVRRGQKQLGAG